MHLQRRVAESDEHDRPAESDENDRPPQARRALLAIDEQRDSMPSD